MNDRIKAKRLVHGLLRNNDVQALTITFTNMIYVPLMFAACLMPLEIVLTITYLANLIIALVTIFKLLTLQDDNRTVHVGAILRYYPVKYSDVIREMELQLLKTMGIQLLMGGAPMLLLFLKFSLTTFLATCASIALIFAAFGIICYVDVSCRRNL